MKPLFTIVMSLLALAGLVLLAYNMGVSVRHHDWPQATFWLLFLVLQQIVAANVRLERIARNTKKVDILAQAKLR